MKTTALILFIIGLYSTSLVAANYVDNQQCLNCHHQQAKQWQQSDHYFSMLPANKKSVLGNFANQIYHDKYQRVIFFKKNNDYFIKTKPLKGEQKTYRVKYTFGYKPLQQYLLEFPHGKLQAFSIAWDTLHKKWINLAQDEDNLVSSPLHWTKRFYNWNHSCADCHSTNYQKRYRNGQYHPYYSGVNVNCQACHGPGSEHLKWAKGQRKGAHGLVIDYAKLTSRQKVDQCAQCHSRRTQLSKVYDPTKPYNHQYMTALLRPSIYYADGQIKEEVFVYGSFIQSKMYQAGVQCMDCHQPHSLKLRYNGNQVCTQCHNDTSTKRYPGLKSKDYTSIQHTHHKQSPGNQCVSCHMPATTYMKVDDRRDHSFKIPTPQATIDYGIPNACNRCHQDKSALWAKEKLIHWFDHTTQNSPLLLNDNTHLLKLAHDTKQPEIFRASALLLLSVNSNQVVKALTGALKSPSTQIKIAALSRLASLPLPFREKEITALLNDDNPIIRGLSADLLGDSPSTTQLKSYTEAIDNYHAMQQANADQGESHMNLAQLYLRQQKKTKAIGELKLAIKLDPHFIPAYRLLTQLQLQNKHEILATQTLQTGLLKNPNDASLYNDLGLLYAEQKNYSLAQHALQQAYSINPSYPRVAYNLSLVLLKTNQEQQAIKILKQALQLMPNNQDLINNMIHISIKRQDWPTAKQYLQLLIKLAPNNRQAQQLLYQLP